MKFEWFGLCRRCYIGLGARVLGDSGDDSCTGRPAGHAWAVSDSHANASITCAAIERRFEQSAYTLPWITPSPETVFASFAFATSALGFWAHLALWPFGVYLG